MGKITISGDTLEEISDTLDMLFGTAGPAPTGPEVAAAAPKATRTRTSRKAEAPAPAQPNEAQAAQPSNPFTAQQPQQPQQQPFAPGAGPFAPNGAAERPAVTQLKNLLNTLSAQHGEPQVYAWCMQRALNLPPTVTKEHFLSDVIYTVPDEKLIEIYKTGGGA
jgi:hypothetical protein